MANGQSHSATVRNIRLADETYRTVLIMDHEQYENLLCTKEAIDQPVLLRAAVTFFTA